MRIIALVLYFIAISIPSFALERVAIEPDYERLANAIYRSEGGANTRHPYGILKRYKTTTSRQACINTCKRAFRDYTKEVDIVRPGASNSKIHALEIGYATFLRDRYCPIGADNDPTGLNKHWLKNVMYFYNKGES